MNEEIKTETFYELDIDVQDNVILEYVIKKEGDVFDTDDSKIGHKKEDHIHEYRKGDWCAEGEVTVKKEISPEEDQNYTSRINEEGLEGQKENAVEGDRHKLYRKSGRPRASKKVCQSPKDKFTCEMCDKELSTKESFLEHCRMHEAQKVLTCNYCDQEFKDVRSFWLHTRMHTKVKVHECYDCRRVFSMEEELRQHYLKGLCEIRSKPGQFHKCNYCEKAFKRKYHWKRHQSVHTGEKHEYRKDDWCAEGEVTVKKESSPEEDQNYTSRINEEGLEGQKENAVESDRHKLYRKSGRPRASKKVCQSPKDKFTCEMCDKELSTKESFLEHCRMHEAEKVLTCNYCDQEFKDVRSFWLHTRMHTKVKVHECYDCRRVCSTEEELRQHYLKGLCEIRSKPRPFHKCNYCEKAFKRKDLWKRHQSVHTGEKPFQCEVCGLTFRLKSLLDNHSLVHTVETPYECRICKKRTKRKDSLREHYKIHCRNGECQCDPNTCLSGTASNVEHISRHSDEEGNEPDAVRSVTEHTCKIAPCHDEKFQCELCGKLFSTKRKLTDHSRTHSGEKPFRCQTCFKTFKHRSTLRSHKRIHTGEKRYQCKKCRRRFCNGASLRNHYRLHTGEMPYHCPQCRRSFRTKQCLRNHKLNHMAERPHKCNSCSKSFIKKSSLQRHQTVHWK